MPAPLVSLLTDFGLGDPSVGIVKGVIWRIVPDARLLDVSHVVTPHAVAEGAALLWAALPYLEVGTHLAVVDPGVGSERRAIAVRVGRGDHLVGPDNGLLPPAAERLGGIVACHGLESEAYRLVTLSATFHGRDLFAPAAAHLARGVAISELGPAVDPASLVRLPATPPVARDGALEATVAFVDTFGNVQLLADRDDLEQAIGRVAVGDPLRVEIVAQAADGTVQGLAAQRGSGAAAEPTEATWQVSYGFVPAGTPLVCVDSYGRLALALNLDSAAGRYGIVQGQRVRLTRR